MGAASRRSFLTGLECSACGTRRSHEGLAGLCSCGKPLLARYDLEAAADGFSRDDLAGRESSMWRYFEMLPAPAIESIVTLGEGWTPLLRAPRLGARFGLDRVWIKDEALNPTGSFKARGMSAAVTMACLNGAAAFAVPSAGNAAGALAAYAARAGRPSHIFMPSDTPRANVVECEYAGANVTLVDGLITDCGRIVAERKDAEGWFDVSTLKEPYRIEGKKTMGYEIAEQFGWELPDVILYPTGGGTGLIGMWKAFDEMEALGWIGSHRPRMVSVQAAGCAPIVAAFEAGERHATEFPNAHTVASGLRVPRAIGDFLILDAVRASGGTAIAVPDEELIDGVREIASTEGVFAAPEGGACVAALRVLAERGDVGRGDRVVIFNTGTGAKYLEALGA
ncbi:MAG TPA: threonine synthase [Blastocatellia bacterium]|nr:threonine synthase [Blastocatellia bacterium]